MCHIILYSLDVTKKEGDLFFSPPQYLNLITLNPELKQSFLELLKSLSLSKLHKLLFCLWDVMTYHLSLCAFLYIVQTKNPHFAGEETMN